MTLPMKTIIINNRSLPGTELDKGLVFLDIDSGDYLTLQATGRDIWERLDKPLEVETLLEQLSTSYGISPEQCATDTLPFLEQLLEAGLIRTIDSAESP